MNTANARDATTIFERNGACIKKEDNTSNLARLQDFIFTLLQNGFRIIRAHVWIQITLAILGVCLLQRAFDLIDIIFSEFYYIITIYPLLAFGSSLMYNFLTVAYYVVKVYPIPTAIICSLLYEYPHVFKKYVYTCGQYAHSKLYQKAKKA